MDLSHITLIVNIAIFLICIAMILNIFENKKREIKIKRNFEIMQKKLKNQKILEQLISKIKYLQKLSEELDIKISVCGFSETSYDVLQKSFIFSLIGVLLGIFMLNPIAIILFALIGFAIPIVNINDKFHKQFKKTDRQILRALQLFLNEYQKTKNITEVLESICPKLEYPIKSAFEKLLRQINSGINMKKALNNFAKEMKNEWIYMFVNALIMNEEKGSEIIDVLMRTITEIANKEIVRSENDMETFSGRILNKIMMFTVPGAFIFVLIAQPEAKYLFFNTFQGKMVINIAVILCIVSFVITRVTEKF